jgi:Ni,Fe-hydrogenase maturation factor
MTRVLVAGVGYRNLRDHSCGVVLADRLAAREWPPHVSIEDLSYNPIAVVQRLQDDPPDRRFALAILIGALPRPGQPPGSCRDTKVSW